MSRLMLYRIFGTILLTWLLVASNYKLALAGEFGPFQGKIVDADTKEPVEGVVVLFYWYQKHFFAGSTFIDAQATLTDRNGEFYIPGIWVLNPWKRLNIYSSYGSTSSSGGHIEGPWYPLLEMEWGALKGTFIWKFENGKPVIMLKKLTVEERKKYGTPGWEGIPNEKAKLLIQEINKEGKFFGLDEVGPVRRQK